MFFDDSLGLMWHVVSRRAAGCCMPVRQSMAARIDPQISFADDSGHVSGVAKDECEGLFMLLLYNASALVKSFEDVMKRLQ